MIPRWRERARIGALARNSPDTYIGQLERAVPLTTGQKRRLAALLMPFLEGDDAAAGAR